MLVGVREQKQAAARLTCGSAGRRASLARGQPCRVYEVYIRHHCCMWKVSLIVLCTVAVTHMMVGVKVLEARSMIDMSKRGRHHHVSATCPHSPHISNLCVPGVMGRPTVVTKLKHSLEKVPTCPFGPQSLTRRPLYLDLLAALFISEFPLGVLL